MNYRFLFLFFLLAGCSSGIPDDVLPPQKMKQVQWDMMQADEMVEHYKAADTNYNAEQQRLVYYSQVMQLHRITKADFDRSLDYYTANPKLLKALVDSMKTMGENLQRQTRDTSIRQNLEADTAMRTLQSDSGKLKGFLKRRKKN